MRRNLGFFGLLALAALVIGCGGSGDSGAGTTSSTDGSTATTANFNAGVAALNNALSSQNVSATDLQTASNKFKAAVDGGGDARAVVGYSVAQSALIANDAATSLGVGSLNIAARNAPLGGVPSLPALLKSFPAIGTRTFPASPTMAQALAALRTAEPRIKAVVALLTDVRLSALESNPLVLNVLIDNQVKSVKIGSVEGYALRGALQAADGALDGLLAYNLDFGTYAYNAPFTEIAGFGSETPPSAYLPSGDFLKLNGDGQDRLRSLKSQWLAAETSARASISSYQARTGTGWATDLLRTPPTPSEIASAKGDLDLFHQALTTTISVPMSGSTITLNLSAWLGGAAPDSLRVYAPTVVDTQGRLTPKDGSVSDLTFKGLVPNGYPASAYYSRAFHDESTVGEVAAWALAGFGSDGGGSASN